MPLTPAIPVTGIAGLRFIDRTYDRQFEAFNNSPDLAREIEHFKENAPNITSVDDLMADRRVLNVVLSAFGLDEDQGKNAFIRKVIEEGTFDPGAFSNRLVDPRYREMAEFLGLGNFTNSFEVGSRRDEIVARFQERQFENAVGDVDFDLRLAMNFRREAVATVDRIDDLDTTWLGLLGSQPLRAVLEGAMNLPAQFGQADLDLQVEEIKDRASRIFGISDPEDLKDEEVMDRVVDRYLAISQSQSGAISSSVRGSVALTVLQSSPLGAGGQANLFASNFI